MSGQLKAEDFEQQLNQSVNFSAEAVSFEAEIKLVDRLDQHSTQSRQPFSVVFSTRLAEAFNQKTYTMKHPEMGEQMIFLVPIGPDKNGMCYEAIFS